MESRQIFRCGNYKYYVIGQRACFVVRRQGWMGETFIGYARDIADAMTLIRHDARSVEIRAA
jgi:hypothetical protein